MVLIRLEELYEIGVSKLMYAQHKDLDGILIWTVLKDGTVVDTEEVMAHTMQRYSSIEELYNSYGEFVDQDAFNVFYEWELLVDE